MTTCAATAGYVGLWAALIAFWAPAAPVPCEVRALASHRPGSPATWSAAPRVYDEVERRMAEIVPAQRTRVARAILEEAARAAMDPLLVLAVIEVESRFDAHAVSEAGAVGLMQLLDPTMREEVERSRLASADPYDPVANVRAGVRYLSRLVTAFDDLELGLLAYNAGPNRIRRHLREGAVPERLRAYPRTVARELRRLVGSPEPEAGDRRRLAAAGSRHRPAQMAAHARADHLAGAPGRATAIPVLVATPLGAAARDEQPILVALASVRRARSPFGGSSARSPRSRS